MKQQHAVDQSKPRTEFHIGEAPDGRKVLIVMLFTAPPGEHVKPDEHGLILCHGYSDLMAILQHVPVSMLKKAIRNHK